MGPDGVHQQGAKDGSGDGADGKGFDPDRVGEEDATEDRPQAVDQRRDGLYGELLPNQEDCSEYASGEKAELRG